MVASLLLFFTFLYASTVNVEKHVQKYLVNFLMERSILSPGFMEGRSTTCVLVDIVDRFHLTLERGHNVCAVFLDLSKAFDKVPHRPLLAKLEELGVDQHIVCWIANYLLQRSQYVVVNGECSLSSPVVSGVPQGSVLGPLLFLVYINDVSKQVHSGCLISVFAYNILIHMEIGCAEDYDLLQENIEDVSTWIAHQYMFLNVNKCKYTIISRKRAPTLPKISLSSPLEWVSKFKYLGVWLADNLSWSYHIKETSIKATKIAGMIYILCGTQLRCCSSMLVTSGPA